MSELKPARSAFAYVGIGLRGAMMGIAEVIPGVSGGTIAFISGIYDELLSSIARFGPASFEVLRRAGVSGFWQHHNMSFLATLAAGMFLSLVTVARLVKLALETSPPLVWAFFFGLIVASVFVLLRGLKWSQVVMFGGIGLALGLLLSRLAPASLDVQWWMLVPGGMLAVTAWILPGISGSHNDLPPMDKKKELAIYRIVQESVNNAIKHADASQIDIHLTLESGQVVAKVVDNGNGIAKDKKDSAGLGLTSMRERAVAFNGSVNLESASKTGTTVLLILPI